MNSGISGILPFICALPSDCPFADDEDRSPNGKAKGCAAHRTSNEVQNSKNNPSRQPQVGSSLLSDLLGSEIATANKPESRVSFLDLSYELIHSTRARYLVYSSLFRNDDISLAILRVVQRY